MSPEFLIVWYSLLSAPILAFGFYFAIRHRCPSFHKPIALISAFLFLLLGSSVALNVSFVESLVNFVCFAITYFAFCYLVASCGSIPSKFFRILAKLIFSIPIGIGYLLGTWGLFGLMFIVGEESESPKYTEKLEAGLSCNVTRWGAAFGDSGYKVNLYENLSLAPFLQRLLVTVSVNEADERASPRSASCSEVFETYKKSHNP
jgi:hypothetical protein